MQKMQGVVYYFQADKFRMEVVDQLVKQYRNKIKFSPGKDPYITYKMQELSDERVLEEVKEFLKQIES